MADEDAAGNGEEPKRGQTLEDYVKVFKERWKMADQLGLEGSRSKVAIKPVFEHLMKQEAYINDLEGRLSVLLEKNSAQEEFKKEVAKPHLGLATTEELLYELLCRTETDYHMGGGGLQYTTAFGRPSTQALGLVGQPVKPFRRS